MTASMGEGKGEGPASMGEGKGEGPASMGEGKGEGFPRVRPFLPAQAPPCAGRSQRAD